MDKSLKTLFITRHLPYPPMGGAPLRNWQNINIMMNFGSVAVVYIRSAKAKEKGNYPLGVDVYEAYQLEERGEEKQFLGKIKQKLRFLRPQIHPSTDQIYSDEIAENLKKLLLNFKPHIVIFEEITLYPYFKKIKNYQCHFICDAHNIEASLWQGIYRSIPSITTIKSAFFLAKIRFIESSFFHQVDRVWVCSNDDADLINKYYDYHRQISIQVVPNGVNIDDYRSIYLGTCSLPENLPITSRTIIFTASFDYKPNSIAAHILIEQIYPQLKKIYPDCCLLLVGCNPTGQMKKAGKNNPEIIVTGKVPDIRPYLAAASVVVVPLLDGGGTRLKILEAFAAGRPVVSTSKGAEGIKGRDGEHLLIRDSIEEIVDGICQIWSDPFLGKKLADSAYDLVKQEYSWEGVGDGVQKAIKKFL
ncbi:MAG: glycosyltransferase family 4 protein [Xenococcaceae cyanobacterium MO_188.B29]|nr:glycosyltransferase family 4 protein [Xenococcaceae cyanobacterium MO_188.B29]